MELVHSLLRDWDHSFSTQRTQGLGNEAHDSFPHSFTMRLEEWVSHGFRCIICRHYLVRGILSHWHWHGPDHWVLKGDMGVRDLGIPQKPDLRLTLKAIPWCPRLLLSKEGSFFVSEELTLLRDCSCWKDQKWYLRKMVAPRQATRSESGTTAAVLHLYPIPSWPEWWAHLWVHHITTYLLPSGQSDTPPQLSHLPEQKQLCPLHL